MPAGMTERLALLAHDLRTPLAAMKLTAELIARDGLTELQAERLEILVRSIDALDDMAGELVRDPALSAGISAGASDFGVIVSETGGLLQAAAAAKGLGFSVTVPDAAVPVDAAKAAPLRRIIGALLDNAIKYTDAGRVAIRLELPASREGSEARVIITDTGPGIDPAEREQLFRPFVRGKTGRAKTGGSGLGLWGAVQLSSEAGASLRLMPETEAETGTGCQFELTLPLTPAAATGVAGSDAAANAEPAAGLHVLIVDDNDTNRRLLAALLESFSITSDQAESGEEAVRMVAEGRFDAVLLDLHMPGLDGMETAEAIRSGAAGQDVPLIAVTAAAETADEKRMRAAGFADMIAKPLSPAKLFTVLEHAKQFHQKRQEPEGASV
ncbi:response regulator [Labrenzia suaedae]|uniref:histidine kinase n=2 Tax=Roseibium litorale TaxID=2803841 RepID=A0ABR9CNW3_9HYPH|nr:response regulator [Roseibium litorale]